MIRTSHLRIGVKLVVAAAIAVAIAMVAAPISAVADDGTRTHTTNCNFTLEAHIRPHVGYRNCSLVWGKNIFDGSYWQTIKFDLLDAQTDGHCARAEAGQWVDQWNRTGVWYTNECNGVWRTRSRTFGGPAEYIQLFVGWGSTNDHNGWVDYDVRTWRKPPGF